MASGGRPPQRKSPAGTSTSAATDRTCRPAAEVWRAEKLFSASSAPLVTAPKGRAGSAIVWSDGQGTLASAKPVRTVGSYWPYAPTLFDYIRRAMPQNAPQSLGNEDVYAVSAYILNLNGLVAADAVLDAKALAAIKMPNRDAFVEDPRPDVQNR